MTHRKNMFQCLVCDHEFSFATHAKVWPTCPVCNANANCVINIDEEDNTTAFEPKERKVRMQYV